MKHEALEEFINSFKPMPLTKAFFLKIYGYELTWSGSAERCLQRLEELGSSRARKLYAAVAADYEEKQEKTTQEVAAWYAEQLERQMVQQGGESVEPERTDPEYWASLPEEEIVKSAC